MDATGDSATQYGKSGKCMNSFSPKSGVRASQYFGDDVQRGICSESGIKNVYL
jgi:hypothetical protein